MAWAIGSADLTGFREETRVCRTMDTPFTGFSTDIESIGEVADLVRARGFVTFGLTLISGVDTLVDLDFLVSIA